MTLKRTSLAKRQPKLIAIAGGTGAGKSYLSGCLKELLGKNAVCLSLDNFYHDLSHLSVARRARTNFDHPRSLDWEEFERVLRSLAMGRAARVPQYDFA